MGPKFTGLMEGVDPADNNAALVACNLQALSQDGTKAKPWPKPRGGRAEVHTPRFRPAGASGNGLAVARAQSFARRMLRCSPGSIHSAMAFRPIRA